MPVKEQDRTLVQTKAYSNFKLRYQEPRESDTKDTGCKDYASKPRKFVADYP